MKDLYLSEFKKDALKELGNMCASHAANALSEMLGGKVDVTAPELNVVRIKDMGTVVRGREEVIPVYSRLFGGISGSVIMLFTPTYGQGKVERLSRAMIGSLGKAMSSFFGVALRPSVAVLPVGSPAAVLDYLRSKLGRGVDKAVFFSTTFHHDGAKACHFFLSLNYDDISYIMRAQIPEFTEEYGSFSDLLETFEKLKGIEVKLYDVLRNTRISKEEIRSFLRNFDPDALPGEALYKRLVHILSSCGIGDGISISRLSPLELVFRVEECNVCKITPVSEGKNSCYTTTTTLGRIFSELMGIGCEVREAECAKNNADACIHHVTMEQLDVFQILPLEDDFEFLAPLSAMSRELTSLSPSELRTADIYAHYGVTSMEDGAVGLTDLGRIFLTFAQNKPAEKAAAPEDKPPWEK
jgi:chemotaxis protein CheC